MTNGRDRAPVDGRCKLLAALASDRSPQHPQSRRERLPSSSAVDGREASAHNAVAASKQLSCSTVAVKCESVNERIVCPPALQTNVPLHGHIAFLASEEESDLALDCQRTDD